NALFALGCIPTDANGVPLPQGGCRPSCTPRVRVPPFPDGCEPSSRGIVSCLLSEVRHPGRDDGAPGTAERGPGTAPPLRRPRLPPGTRSPPPPLDAAPPPCDSLAGRTGQRDPSPGRTLWEGT